MLFLAKRMAKNREHLYRKIFIVNQRTASWESTCSPQDFHGQSNASGESSPQDFHCQPIAYDEISSVGAESHSGMELKATEKATQTKLKGIHARVLTQWPPEDTSDAVLYFLTTCTALCRRGTLKWLLMSVIIDKRVSREPPHRRNLRLNHLLWLPTMQQLDAADAIALYIITFDD